MPSLTVCSRGHLERNQELAGLSQPRQMSPTSAYCELSYWLPWILWWGYGGLYNVCFSRYLGLGHLPASPASLEETLPDEKSHLHHPAGPGLPQTQAENGSILLYEDKHQTVRKQNKSRLVNKITWYFTEDKFMGYLSCVVLTTLSPSH